MIETANDVVRSLGPERDGATGLVIGDDEDRSMLHCPVCRFDYSHIAEVFTRFGLDESYAAYPGTVAKTVAPRWRRNGLVIVIDGECGHRWQLIIQQHKGQNLLLIRTVEEVEMPF